VHTIIQQQTKAQARQVVTDDLLNSSDKADLFTKGLVGQSFQYISAAYRKENDEKSPIIVWVKKGTRMMSWFARTYFSSVVVGDVPMGRHILETNDFPKTIKIVNFEATKDFYGNGFYDRRILDMRKMEEHLNDAFVTYTDRNATMEERGSANNDIRRDILLIVQDQFLKDGQITPEAEEKYRLGRLIVEVVDNLD